MDIKLRCKGPYRDFELLSGEPELLDAFYEILGVAVPMPENLQSRELGHFVLFASFKPGYSIAKPVKPGLLPRRVMGGRHGCRVSLRRRWDLGLAYIKGFRDADANRLRKAHRP